ncbi:hypothetical protein SASPL_121101 [Salvia splendens]|uniref:Uncharacterized protein n=1 Tax=Salvia splendens TaxID=180675 RepID=A0A8X8XVG5_SALSN|nr:hypothetical protein SASPL_121101 [Salvia splendens]
MFVSWPCEKPLEQEPMLAARVTIEDGICLHLDIDDIDSFLQFNHLPDGVAQLKQRKQIFLEELASSFHLIDPLGNNGNAVNLSSKDDLTISSCIHRMELKALAACLASVVCSAEHPPLRPVDPPSAGDGASVVVKSVLATEHLTDPHAADSCSISNRPLLMQAFLTQMTSKENCCWNYAWEGLYLVYSPMLSELALLVLVEYEHAKAAASACGLDGGMVLVVVVPCRISHWWRRITYAGGGGYEVGGAGYAAVECQFMLSK